MLACNGLSSVRHILLKISRKSILFCDFTSLCLTYKYKLQKKNCSKTIYYNPEVIYNIPL